MISERRSMLIGEEWDLKSKGDWKRMKPLLEIFVQKETLRQVLVRTILGAAHRFETIRKILNPGWQTLPGKGWPGYHNAIAKNYERQKDQGQDSENRYEPSFHFRSPLCSFIYLPYHAEGSKLSEEDIALLLFKTNRHVTLYETIHPNRCFSLPSVHFWFGYITYYLLGALI